MYFLPLPNKNKLKFDQDFKDFEQVLNALGQLCLWQCLGSWCNIHISLKNNNDLVLMMTVMMRPSCLNVERGASQIRLTGLAYKKRTSDFNG